jgi:pentatricopeptide repeat protein
MTELQRWNLWSIDKEGGYGILLYPKDFDKFKVLVLYLKQGNFEEAEVVYKELKGRWW